MATFAEMTTEHGAEEECRRLMKDGYSPHEARAMVYEEEAPSKRFGFGDLGGLTLLDLERWNDRGS